MLLSGGGLGSGGILHDGFIVTQDPGLCFVVIWWHAKHSEFKSWARDVLHAMLRNARKCASQRDVHQHATHQHVPSIVIAIGMSIITQPS